LAVTGAIERRPVERGATTMVHRPRLDAPGAFHHVMNRALGRRTLFERRRDFRYFLSLVARAVHRGEIELFAYALMSTHFHLIVRSLKGTLSETMADIEREYVRWFNRTRDRDGPLFRGRFVSRRIDNPWYLRAAAVYVDRNPVEAGLADTPESYEWCSAEARARRRVPPWLVRKALVASGERAAFQDAAWCIARQASGPIGEVGDDPLDDLIGAPADRIRAWMARRAAIADGTTPGTAVTTPRAGDRALAETPVPPELDVGRWARGAAARRSLRIALLRQCGGLSWDEIHALEPAPRSTLRLACRRHADRMRSDPRYREWSATTAQRAIDSCFSRGARIGVTPMDAA
jgi:REP element-mobilizing transposase RayT